MLLTSNAQAALKLPSLKGNRWRQTQRLISAVWIRAIEDWSANWDEMVVFNSCCKLQHWIANWDERRDFPVQCRVRVGEIVVPSGLADANPSLDSSVIGCGQRINGWFTRLGNSATYGEGNVSFQWTIHLPQSLTWSTGRGIWSRTCVGLTLFLVEPPSARFCWGRWESGSIGIPVGQNGGIAKIIVKPTRVCDKMSLPVAYFEIWMPFLMASLTIWCHKYSL